MRKSVLVCFLIATLINYSYSIVITPPVYYPTNKHYYQLIIPDSPFTYNAASSYASAQSLINAVGYLVTISDVGESNFVQNNFLTSQIPSDLPYPATWTNAKKTNDNWMWYALTRVSASFYDQTSRQCVSLQFCNWASSVGEPINNSSRNNMQMNFALGDPLAGKWFAKAATDLASLFVIEYDTPTCPAKYTFDPVAIACIPVCNPSCIHGTCVGPNTCQCAFGWSGSTCATATGFWIQTDLQEGLVLDLAGGSTEPGTAIVLAQKTDSLSQIWNFADGGWIVNALTGLVIDIYGGNLDVNTQLIVWNQKPADQAANQQWTLTAEGSFISVAGPWAMDIYQFETDIGTPAIIWYQKTEEEGNQNQLFTLISN